MGACPRRPENGGNGMPDNKTIEMLIDQALSMMSRSYIPYSNFAVGAALAVALNTALAKTSLRGHMAYAQPVRF